MSPKEIERDFSAGRQSGFARSSEGVEKAITGVLKEVQNLIEAAWATVVRIRNLTFLVMPTVAADQSQSGLAGDALAEVIEVGKIGFVHGDDVVKFLKVRGADLSGPAFKVVSATAGRLAHSGIGPAALMVTDGPGGIDQELPGETGFLDAILENGLGGRGSADISHADKKDRGGHKRIGG